MTVTEVFDTTRGPIPLHDGERRFIAPPAGQAHASAFDIAGTDVSAATNVEEALRIAGLDWTVSKRDVFVGSENNGFATIPDKQAIVRDDTGFVLGVTSKAYEPVQSVDALVMLDELIDSEGLEIVSAGEYRSGRQVWMQARLPQSGGLALAGDPHVPYLLFANGHDGSMALRFIAGSLRLFCGNALPTARRRAAGGEGSVWSVAHRRNVTSRLDEARVALGLAVEDAGAFVQMAEELLGLRVAMPTVDAFLASLFPATEDTAPAIRTRAEAKRAEVRALYTDESRLGVETGNWWGLVQAINTWATWERPTIGQRGSADRSLGLALKGSTDDYTRQALVIARHAATLN